MAAPARFRAARSGGKKIAKKTQSATPSRRLRSASVNTILVEVPGTNHYNLASTSDKKRSDSSAGTKGPHSTASKRPFPTSLTSFKRQVRDIKTRAQMMEFFAQISKHCNSKLDVEVNILKKRLEVQEKNFEKNFGRTFHYFPKLPRKIQLLIWKYAGAPEILSQTGEGNLMKNFGRKFHYFPKLPRKVQLLIWKDAGVPEILPLTEEEQLLSVQLAAPQTGREQLRSVHMSVSPTAEQLPPPFQDARLLGAVEEYLPYSNASEQL